MSWTDSSVVNAPRAGPISEAHCSNISPAGSRLGVSNAEQLSGSDAPVPRWSNTSRSRELSAGAIACGDEFGERQRRLAGSAGERDDGVVARA